MSTEGDQRGLESTTRLVLGVVAILIAGSWIFFFVPVPGRAVGAGNDLLAPYAVGRLIDEGRYHQMYDRGAIAEREQNAMRDEHIAGDARFLPWVNPPFAALPFAPLAMLPYRAAEIVWFDINLAMLAVAFVLLRRMMPGDLRPRQIILFYLCIGLSMPFLQAMFSQQNTFVSLALLCLVVHYWMTGQGFWAGVCAGMMLFKPQLAIVIAAVLGISLGADAVVGFSIVGIGLLALTACSMSGIIAAYLHALPPTIHWLQEELPYNWGRQTTLMGFWRLLVQGHARGPTALLATALSWAGAVILGIPLAIAAWRTRGGTPADQRRLIAAAIVATPLIVPYYMDYDLLLLGIAAALTISENKWRFPTAWAWLGVTVAMYLNPFLVSDGRWNVAVIAVAAMSFLLIRNVFANLPRLKAGARLCPAAPVSALSR